jgi:hypothetical protein
MAAEKIWHVYSRKPGWGIAISSGKVGTGDWAAFKRPLDEVRAAAEAWKQSLGDVRRPWLCWNINDEWCIAQQRLVLAVGWTPVIGWDTNCLKTRPTILPGSVAIDFNAQFRFPVMWVHFPLEFAFLWAPRVAFWHSDLLVRLEKMQRLAALFDVLTDGEMAAVVSTGGLRNIFNRKMHRYWELIGCTTRGASENQFDRGCGWWRNIARHPNAPAGEVEKRSTYYYEHGVGVMYWKRMYRGRVRDISERLVSEGHCTRVRNPQYVTDDNKGRELALNFDLQEVMTRLGLVESLPSLDTGPQPREA